MVIRITSGTSCESNRALKTLAIDHQHSRIAPQWRAIGVLVSGIFVSPLVQAATPFDIDAYRTSAFTLATFTSDAIILRNPGMLIDPLYDATDLGAQQWLAANLNAMLKPSLIYKSAQSDIGQLYSNIFTNAQWAIAPLLGAQRQQLTELQNLLYGTTESTPTPSYQRYLDLKKRFDDIQHTYETTPPEQINPELQQKRDQAEEDLQLRGHRGTFEGAEANYAALMDQRSYAWRDVDAQKVLSATIVSRSGEKFLITGTVPNFGDFDGLRWVTMKIAGKQFHHPDGAPKLDSTLNSLSLNWWTISPQNASPASACTNHLTDDNFDVRFEIAFVSIKRDWLDLAVFQSQAWRFPDTSTLISDGQDDANSGAAPLLANSVFLIKDLVITGAAVQSCFRQLRIAIRKEATVGFGPFALSGMNEGPNRQYLSPIFSATSIHVPYPQIIGYGATVLPRTPNPNVDFLWSSQ